MGQSVAFLKQFVCYLRNHQSCGKKLSFVAFTPPKINLRPKEMLVGRRKLWLGHFFATVTSLKQFFVRYLTNLKTCDKTKTTAEGKLAEMLGSQNAAFQGLIDGIG